MQLVAPEVQLHVRPPGLAVAVYPVIVDPSPEAAVHDTVACAAPAVADTLVGMAGAPDTVVLLDALEADEVPSALVAVTVKV